jgi:hypothetical protein
MSAATKAFAIASYFAVWALVSYWFRWLLGG